MERQAERPAPHVCDCCAQCRASIDSLRADSHPWAEARMGEVRERPPAKLTPVQEFENKHAVTVSKNGNEYEYKIAVYGKDKLLFKTDATDQGLAQAEKELAKLIDEKQKELTKSFKVSFSKEGDDVVQQWIEKPDCSWERGPMVKARSPQLLELYGIEAALYRSQPSSLNSKGDEGVKFHFLKDNYYKDQPVLAYYVSSDKDGKPAVYYEPGANNRKPATEADADRMKQHQLFSIEALTIHELNHNHQAKMGWYTPADKEKLAKEIGWLPFVDPKTKEQDWLLQGKNGELFRLGRDHCKDSKVWVKVNKNGEPLDDKGQPAGTFKAAKHFTRNEVTNAALVKPVTYYFVNPTEMFAEGLMLLRLDQKRREELLRESPRLYRAAKVQDQREIDRHFGTEADGTSKFMRDQNGYIVQNNAANRKKIQDVEDKVEAARKKMP